MSTRTRTALVCVLVCGLLRAADGLLAAGFNPAASVSLSSTPAAPRAGLPIVFDASVAAQDESDQFEFAFWVWDAATGWSCRRAYGPETRYVLTPDLSGSYAVQVWMRRAGRTAAYESWASTGFFFVEPGPSTPIAALTADATFPVVAGTSITWTVTPGAPTSTYEYQFWVLNAAGWSIGQPYGTTRSFNWRPAKAGTYAVQVWARRGGAEAPYEDWRTSGLFTVTAPPGIGVVSISGDQPVPVTAGQTASWTAAVTGNDEAEFQFWRLSGGTWTLARDYGSDPRYTWRPSADEAGEHAVQVWARRRGSLGSLESWASTGMFEVVPDQGAPPSPSPCRAIPSYVARDYLSDLVIGRRGEFAARRATLASWIWGGTGSLSSAAPVHDSHESGIDHPQISALELTNLARVDRYRVDVDVPALPDEATEPLRSYIYEFVPENQNGRLLVYAQGHVAEKAKVFDPQYMLGADAVLRTFLDLGYRVVFVQMPLIGDNLDSRFPLDGTNPHDVLGRRAADDFNPLRAFVEPVAAAINYAQARFGAIEISMTGVSGGGWLTTVYAAIDPRVLNSFPVAGSLPYTLNQDPDDPCAHSWDWEQNQFPAPADRNGSPQPLGYLDLYVLGSTSDAGSAVVRQQVQILNRYDPCCWAGAKAENTYAEELSARVAAMRGTYRLAIDSTHLSHLISTWAIREQILPALGHENR